MDKIVQKCKLNEQANKEMMKVTQQRNQSIRGVQIIVEKGGDWKDLPANLSPFTGVQSISNTEYIIEISLLKMVE